MKNLVYVAAALFALASCSQKTQQAENIEKQPAVITWIEDKPGPSMQSRNIFPTVPDSLWEALGLEEGVPSGMNCFLLETEGKTILLDAGLGAPFSQTLAKLEEKGVKAEELELIYITHMHGDHIGGLLSNGQATFPKAEIYINTVEAEAWQAMESSQADQAKQVLEVYKDRLHTFTAGDTLQGGVVTIAAYGHTPGHTVFQKDSILVIADLLHGAAIQLEHPEYCPFFDMDPEAATEARIRILKYAHENNLTMYGMHVPNGKIE